MKKPSLYQNDNGFYYPWVVAVCFTFLLLFTHALHTYEQNRTLNESLKTSYQLQQYYQSAYRSWSPFIQKADTFPVTITRTFEGGSSKVTCSQETSRAVCIYTITYEDLTRHYRRLYPLSKEAE